MFQKIAGSKSNFFAALLFSFVFGVFAAGFINFGNRFFWPFFLISFILTALFLTEKIKRKQLFLGCVLFFFFGLWRFVLSQPSQSPKNLIYYIGRQAQVAGEIISEPVTRNGSQKIVLASQRIIIAGLAEQRSARGKLLILLEPHPAYFYGQKITVDCALEKPFQKTGERFSYADYLGKEGIWVVCLSPKILSVENGKSNIFVQGLIGFRNFLAGRLEEILQEPYAAFAGGLLYGARSNLPPDLTNAFNRTGLSHIVAVSGYNISVISAALLAFLNGIGFSRKRSFKISLFGIVFFVLFAGASSSVVRAGIMGVLVLWAKNSGRSGSAGRVLLFTAFLMLIFNPRLLLFDAGFQLSFLSTIGLIYFTPVLEKIFYFLPSRLGLKDALITTFSALLATYPLIIYQFGRLSLVAPVANLLILPFIPLAMALCFVSLFGAVIFLPLGQIFAYSAWFLLWYMIEVVNWLSGFEWSALELKISGWSFVLFYITIILFIFYLKRKFNEKNSF